MPLIRARNFDFNVEIVKKRAKRDILFLHGNLASNVWWEPTVENWLGEGEGNLYLMEWRGCGNSQKPESPKELEMPELAKDVIAVIEALNIKNLDLVGHSTGGLIGLIAVIEKPEIFNKIVLLDSVGAQGIELKPEMLAAFDMMKNNPSLCVQVMATTIKGVDVNSPLFKRIVDSTVGVAEIVWSGIPQSLSKVDITEQLQKLYHPALVIHGEEDTILDIKDSKFLAESLPGAEFVSVKGHGHSLNLENPKLFVQMLKEFLC